jgi:hypothetical protein
MPRVGFEHTAPVFQRAKTGHALDRAATVIGSSTFTFTIMRHWPTRKWRFMYRTLHNSHHIFWSDNSPCEEAPTVTLLHMACLPVVCYSHGWVTGAYWICFMYWSLKLDCLTDITVFSVATPCWLVGGYQRFGKLLDFQSHGTVKYYNEPLGTRNQQWLCWRVPAAVCLTDVSEVMTPSPKMQAVFSYETFTANRDTCFMLVSCLAYSSIVKMEATCSSETSDDFQQTTRRSIPEDRTLEL